MNAPDKQEVQDESLSATCAKVFGTPLDQKNQKNFFHWTLLWAVTLLATTWMLKAEYVTAPLSWIIAVLPSMLGIGALFSYMRFLRQADEFIRKIELEGLALGFGGGVLFLMGYSALEQVGMPALGHKSGAVMLFAWVFGQLIARRLNQ